ncbi:inovirus Gp2 family protein [Aeromonas veronii]
MNLYQTIYGDHITSYYERIIFTIRMALRTHPRTLALRVDLHDPAIIDHGDMVTCFHNHNGGVMNRFINSLNAKLTAHQQRTALSGKRVYPNTLRYTWVREFSQSGKRHFHVLLFFNKDAFFHLGDYDIEDCTLRSMITTAWCSALSLPPEEGLHLVQYPPKGKYTLLKQEIEKGIYPDDFMNRVHYMTKLKSKSFHDRQRNFGCSCG